MNAGNGWAGIIAAGEGSRLAASHPETVKPLVAVAGRPLIHWVVDGLVGAGADALVVLTNSRGSAIAPSLRRAFPAVNFEFLVADTASSYESFRLVGRRLADLADDFLISTTDAIIPGEDVAKFHSAARAMGSEAGLALTSFVDDENPLWVETKAGFVSAVGADAVQHHAVSCGLYYLTAASAARLAPADRHPRLRDFWRGLVRDGVRVAAPILSKTLDVDRPEDVAAADAHLLTQEAGRR